MKTIIEKLFNRLIAILVMLIIFLNSCEKEVSVSPPDELPSQGTIIFNTNPDGFRIFLNGKDRLRITPDSLRFLEPGVYNFTLKKDLFLDSIFTVELDKDEKRNLFIDYSNNVRMLGKLLINSKPTGAEIFINGSATGLTSPVTLNNLLPGTYEIKLKKEGYEDLVYFSEVKSSTILNKEFTLVDTTVWKRVPLDEIGNNIDNLTSITVDGNNNIWVGSRDGLLLNDGSWRHYNPSNSDLPHTVVNDVGVDDNDRLWVATNGGMALVRDKQVVIRYVSAGQKLVQPTGFPTDVFTSVFVQAGFPYYFGTDIGIGHVDNWFIDDAGTVYVGSNLYNWENPQPFAHMNVYVNSVCIDEETTDIVVSTKTSGVLIGKLHEFLEGKYKVYNRNTFALVSNTAVDAYADKNGGAWIGFAPDGTGIISSLVYLKNGTITENLMSTSDSKIMCVFVDSRNIKWIGTEKGVIYFKNSVNQRIKLDEANTGLKIEKVTGITEDKNGNIWITTFENGIFVIKNIDKLLS